MTTGLHSLSPKYGATHKKKRIGLGRGSGHGETATRGMKGQRKESGDGKMIGFEGGQISLLRRIPKSGFSNTQFARRFEWVNLGSLSRFPAKSEITPEALLKEGLISCTCQVKILGGGALDRALKVSAHAFSKSAKEKIEKAGGSATVIKKSAGNK
ncbi:MAG: 50S ribosomal protein L15 [Elusimicrobiales bacterium]|nr:50S ribosomal protein L15 [Elusimicrobiales bacterium]